MPFILYSGFPFNEGTLSEHELLPFLIHKYINRTYTGPVMTGYTGIKQFHYRHGEALMVPGV
jgi:hypothetical protein